METTCLLVNPLGDAVASNPEQPVQLSPAALESLRTHWLEVAELVTARELHIPSSHIQRARDASASNGNVEVLATVNAVLVGENGAKVPVDLEIECRANGAITLTTYEDWCAKA